MFSQVQSRFRTHAGAVVCGIWYIAAAHSRYWKGLKNPSYEIMKILVSRLGVSPDTLFYSDISEDTVELNEFMGRYHACSKADYEILIRTLNSLADKLLRRASTSNHQASTTKWNQQVNRLCAGFSVVRKSKASLSADKLASNACWRRCPNPLLNAEFHSVAAHSANAFETTTRLQLLKSL